MPIVCIRRLSSLSSNDEKQINKSELSPVRTIKLFWGFFFTIKPAIFAYPISIPDKNGDNLRQSWISKRATEVKKKQKQKKKKKQNKEELFKWTNMSHWRSEKLSCWLQLQIILVEPEFAIFA